MHHLGCSYAKEILRTLNFIDNNQNIAGDKGTYLSITEAFLWHEFTESSAPFRKNSILPLWY